MDVEPRLQKVQRGRQAADAAADDGDLRCRPLRSTPPAVAGNQCRARRHGRPAAPAQVSPRRSAPRRIVDDHRVERHRRCIDDGRRIGITEAEQGEPRAELVVEEAAVVQHDARQARAGRGGRLVDDRIALDAIVAVAELDAPALVLGIARRRSPGRERRSHRPFAELAAKAARTSSFSMVRSRPGGTGVRASQQRPCGSASAYLRLSAFVFDRILGSRPCGQLSSAHRDRSRVAITYLPTSVGFVG